MIIFGTASMRTMCSFQFYLYNVSKWCGGLTSCKTLQLMMHLVLRYLNINSALFHFPDQAIVLPEHRQLLLVTGGFWSLHEHF